MAILTKPGTINKGTPAQFSLNKIELVGLPEIASDPYFNDIGNWYKVYVVYKSNPGRQAETVSFDATELSPIGLFNVSNKARAKFEVQYIIIFDFDNASLSVSREDIPNAQSQFDVTLA